MTRSNFINVLEGLKPASVRKSGVSSTIVHRRAVVGTTTTFEVLASRFEDVSEDEGKDEVVLFSPFVSGEVEGKSVLVSNFCRIISPLPFTKESTTHSTQV